MDSNLLALEAILWSVAVSRWTVTFNTKWSMIAIHFPFLCAQGNYLSGFCDCSDISIKFNTKTEFYFLDSTQIFCSTSLIIITCNYNKCSNFLSSKEGVELKNNIMTSDQNMTVRKL